MEPRVERLEKTVFGNGKDGLLADNACNKLNIEQLQEISSNQVKAINGLLKFQIEETVKEDEREKHRKERVSARRFAIAQSITILGVIVTFIIYILRTR